MRARPYDRPVDVKAFEQVRRIRGRRLSEQILAFLPDLSEVHQIGRQIPAYVDEQLTQIPVVEWRYSKTQQEDRYRFSG